VGSYLKKNGLNTLAQKAFLRAVDRYKEFLEKYKRSEWTPLAILQLARAYKELGKYQDAVREAQKILADYKNTDAVVDAYRFLGDVYADDLKDINSAKYYYALLLEKFPGYPFAQAVQRKLIQLQ
jgi:tetratricopeptide (TPR) repeat protein